MGNEAEVVGNGLEPFVVDVVDDLVAKFSHHDLGRLLDGLAEVGLGLPDVLAEGAASGSPLSLIMSFAK